jgi:hypothetical protein
VRTILIQAASGEYQPLLGATVLHHQKYCERHAVTYLPCFGRVAYDRHPNWDRLPLLLMALDSGLFELVIWMDADTVIVDFETDLREATGEFTHIGLAANPVSWRGWGFHFNFGVAYVRATRESLDFLRQLRNLGPVENEHHWENQGALHTLLQRGGFHVDRIDNRWNSAAHNNVPHPVVRAFHGVGPSALAELKKLVPA